MITPAVGLQWRGKKNGFNIFYRVDENTKTFGRYKVPTRSSIVFLGVEPFTSERASVIRRELGQPTKPSIPTVPDARYILTYGYHPAKMV